MAFESATFEDGDERKGSTLPKTPVFKGSRLGSEWDDRKGAGSAAASILGRMVICGWKVIGSEVKHPNSSSLPAMVQVVLEKSIPNHDGVTLTGWYARRTDRWRVLSYKVGMGMCIGRIGRE